MVPDCTVAPNYNISISVHHPHFVAEYVSKVVPLFAGMTSSYLSSPSSHGFILFYLISFHFILFVYFVRFLNEITGNLPNSVKHYLHMHRKVLEELGIFPPI